MDRVDGKGGNANRNILSAVGTGSTVLHPFAAMSNHGFSGSNLDGTASEVHMKRSAQHDGVFIELGRLTRFDPSARTLHSSDADPSGTRIHAANILFDDFGFGP